MEIVDLINKNKTTVNVKVTHIVGMKSFCIVVYHQALAEKAYDRIILQYEVDYQY